MFGLFRRKKKEPLPPSPQLIRRAERLTQRLQRAGTSATSPSSTDDCDDGANALTTGILTGTALDMLQSTVAPTPATAELVQTDI